MSVDMHLSSLDNLTKAGIIPFDANAYVYGKPPTIQPSAQVPQVKLPAQPSKDEYKPKNPHLQNNPGIMKKIMATLLATYIFGVVASKGKLNPWEGLKAIGSFFVKMGKFVCNIFK